MKTRKHKKKIHNTPCLKTTTFKPFEKDVEKVFKSSGLDITAENFNLEKHVIKQLAQSVNTSNIKPNEDFYSYINERWIDDLDSSTLEGKDYITQFDNFRLTQDKVYKELIEIINSSKKDQSAAFRNAFKSFQHFYTVGEFRGLVQETVQQIDSAISAGPWDILALANSNEIISWGSPFVWSLNPDDKNPGTYCCYLDPPQLTLMDVDVYFQEENPNNYKREYKRKYLAYIDELFRISNQNLSAEHVFQVERSIIDAMICTDINDNLDSDRYNLITGSEALNTFGFDWAAFSSKNGFKKVPSRFVCSNVNYLLCGTRLLKEKWNTPEWRTYWIYIFIRQQARLSTEGAANHFTFHGSFVRGQQGQIPKELWPVFGMSFLYNTFLSNAYIDKFKHDEAVDYVKMIAEDLKQVFLRIVKRNTWMQPRTKRVALEKLEAVKLVVGSPKMLRLDPNLAYIANNPWHNLTLMAHWRHQEAIKLIGKPVIDIPVMDWSELPPKFIGTQAYLVNANYTPTENRIYIPLGYIQPPFIDLNERGIEYNLAHIGFTIAHEMSHALDDFGSKYDKDGRLRDWWSKADKREFRRIQTDIVRQYEEYALKDGIEFDAWPSIGEDLADIAGFDICQEYLRDIQQRNQDILPIQSLSFEAFYVYFAVQSRQKISAKAIAAQLKSNPHPLDKYRCNVPLSRSRIFRAIYNVKRGDDMWWKSANGVWTD